MRRLLVVLVFAAASIIATGCGEEASKDAPSKSSEQPSTANREAAAERTAVERKR